MSQRPEIQCEVQKADSEGGREGTNYKVHQATKISETIFFLNKVTLMKEGVTIEGSLFRCCCDPSHLITWHNGQSSLLSHKKLQSNGSLHL